MNTLPDCFADQLLGQMAGDIPLRLGVRLLAGDRSMRPIVVSLDEPNAEPRIEGEGYYWTTPSGKTRVYYPNAYKWPTMYWPSTRRVVVGIRWVQQALARKGGLFRREHRHIVVCGTGRRIAR